MIGPVQPRRNGRLIAALAAVLALGSLVVGISTGSDRGPDSSPQVAGTGPTGASPVGTQPVGTQPSGSQPSGSQPTGSAVPSADPPSAGRPNGAVVPVGLTLSAGRAQQPVAPVAVADGQPLSGDQVAAILGRLPAWIGQGQLAQPFRWPTQTTPAPKAGKTVDIAFPGPAKPGGASGPGQPQASPVGPLKVLRVQPQGAVSIAPFVSITFDQPMVPLATVGQLSTVKVPVTISPKLPGSWQWIGTSTLRFAAEFKDFDRLPMATDYVVTVPAGTRSANGATLGSATTFRFATPPPAVKQFAPTGGPVKLDPVFVAVFDQQVDPKAVLATTRVKAGSAGRPIRLATPDEVAADPAAAKVAGAAPNGRVVAFRPIRDLPADQQVTVTFAAGTASAEGPRTTAEATTFTARTYAALSLSTTNCGGTICEPSSPISLTFNNAIDAAAFDPATVKITPGIPGGATVIAADNTILVQGATQPGTTYTVAVPAGLADTFGQRLDSPAKGIARFGNARPRLDPFPQPITTLDPMAGQPSVTVNSLNRKEFRERVFRVSPADWSNYQRLYVDTAQQEYRQNAVLNVPAWPVLVDRIVHISGTGIRSVSTTLDLSAAMSATGSTGHAVVLIEPTAAESFGQDTLWQNRPTMTWAQATTIGLDAFSDSSQLRGWATDLRDGSPMPGVTVGMVGTNGEVERGQSAVTDADGIASLPLTGPGASAMIATRGTQTALLPSAMWNNSWAKAPTKDRLLWFVNDDRQTYRPGETVSVKGWVRRQGSDVAAALSSVSEHSTIAYIVRDANGIQIGHGTAKISRLGGFDLTTEIPAGANLGSAAIELSLRGTPGVADDASYHAFEIADFRTPDFQVATHADSKGPSVIGDDLTVAADATYYAGGPLGDARVDWQVRTSAATYAPPGWSGFTFGIWTPWWQVDGAGFGSAGQQSAGQQSAGRPSAGPSRPCCGPQDPGIGTDASKVEKFTGTTDANGSNFLQVRVGDLGKQNSGLPVALTTQATVTDVNRQAIAGTTDLLVHPSDYYVGLTSDSTFVTQGKDLVVQAIATGIDGAATPGVPIDVRASTLTTSWANGTSVDKESNTQTCRVTSTVRPVSCTFTPAIAGTYRITATVTDTAGRTSRSQLTRWVAGSDGSVDSSVQQQQLTLVPDKKQYQPGEAARVLVQSPIRTGSGLVTVTHNGIVSTSRFAVTDGSAVVSLPITDADIPGITASVEVVGTAPRSAAGPGASAPPRPAYATGGIGLTVSTLARTLKVTATPRQHTVAPGGSTQLDVTVTDQHGKPLPGSEFEVVVADEAVLALGGYQLPDPLPAFYPELNNRIDAVFGRSTVMLADTPPPPPSGNAPATAAAGSASASSAPAAAPSTRSEQGMAVDSAAAGGRSASSAASSPAKPAIAERKNFAPLALFVPSATTDANGRASIAVRLPDNLTRYRVMLVAVAGHTKFGSAESTITAALPVTVRPSAPAFLNFGDTLQLPVLVQNQTGAALSTDVVIQTANLKLTGPAGQRVMVPAHGRVEVRFGVSADHAGTAKFRVAAVSGGDADAAAIELPVYTPATTESFATYGIVAGGQTVNQPVTAPTGVVSQFGGLQIGTSSTALQQLTDAVGYLADYPYDSSDGLASQVIAIGSLGDVLQAFSAPGLPSPAALKTMVADDVKKLIALQNDDGGFAYWKHGEKSDPFNSIQATQALLVAGRYGSAVPKDNLARAQQYLTRIDAVIPKSASQSTRDTLRAYALNVRMQAGHRDAATAKALVTERGTALPLDAVAWLLPVVDDPGARSTLEREVGNAAVDDAGSVTFTNKVADDAWTTLQSDVRTDGLILDALISVQPDSDLIRKIVTGLMAAQKGGRWTNVQENAFVLLALRHYYDAFEKTTPDFVARIWLGDRFAGEHAYRGHTTERATVTVPTADLLGAGNRGVTLRDSGTGTLYYRLGLQTAPVDLKLTPLDRGFVVSRSFRGADNPADVTRDADGVWHIKAGARVRVKLELVSRSARTHVALIDPVPAGLQILNPELATTPKDLDPQAIKEAESAGIDVPAESWSPSWFDHQNLHHDRAEAFASQLQGGIYQYSYLAKATTVGSFVAPPSRAEQVYAPETFGRTATDRVVIDG